MTEITLDIRDKDAERLNKMAEHGFLDEDMLALEIMQTIREAHDQYKMQKEELKRQQAMREENPEATE